MEVEVGWEYTIDTKKVKRLVAERDRFEAALREIKEKQGKVCPQYTICEHESCASSYASWAIATDALSGDAEGEGDGTP